MLTCALRENVNQLNIKILVFKVVHSTF